MFTSALLTTLKPLTVWITANCGRFLEMGAPDHLTCLLRNLYVGQEAIDRTRHDMEQLTGSKLGKEYDKAVYCRPTYLTSMQSSSYEMPDHKLESRLPGKISTTSDMQTILL